MVTWDEPKRLLNIKDHELDFDGCEVVLDGPVITQEDDRMAYGEMRINLLGLLHGLVVRMTYRTWRGCARHFLAQGDET